MQLCDKRQQVKSLAPVVLFVLVPRGTRQVFRGYF
jgi:hypothetical protein